MSINDKNLALHYEEFLTALARFALKPGEIEDAERFRRRMIGMLDGARSAAQQKYSPSDIDMADLVASALLDETVFKASRKSANFRSWAPVHPARFPRLGQLAGEEVFRNIDSMLDRPESRELADVIELHFLCILLGFEGAFGMDDLQRVLKLRRNSLDDYKSALNACLNRNRRRLQDTTRASEARNQIVVQPEKSTLILIAASVAGVVIVICLVIWLRISVDASLASISG